MAVARKKIFLSIFIVLLVALGGVAGVLYQRLNDVEEIRRNVVEKLEEATGRDVHVGRAELDFKKGIGLRLAEVTIGGEFRGQPRLGAESLWVVVKVLPLLRKQVEIRKLVLQGARVQVIRDKAGQWNIHGLMDRFGEMAPPRGDGLLDVFKVSLIKRVVVQGGRVQVFDFHAGSEAEPVEMNFDSLQLSLRKDFFTPSYKVDVQAKIPHPEHPGSIRVSGKLLNVLSSQGLGFAWEGRASVEGLGLPDFQPYVRQWVPDIPATAQLGLAATFSGEWGGAARSAGTFKYSSRGESRSAALRNPAVPRQGVLDYDVELSGGEMEVKSLRLNSGPFEFSGSGRFSARDPEQPRVSFSIATLPFEVAGSRHFFPLNVLLPDAVHDAVQQGLRAGKLEIQSLEFDGTVEELKNLDDPKIHRRVAARVRLEGMDFAGPLPPFKSVSGTIRLEKGVHTLDLARVVYSDFALTGIRGTLRDAPDNPVADFALENRVDAGRLHAALMKMFAEDPIRKHIEDYQNLEGPLTFSLRLKGPLKKPGEVFVEAGLRFEDVALNEKGFGPRIEHFKGTILCTRSPESDKTPPPLLRFVELSGDFGSSSFSRLNGEVRTVGDATERTLSAFYRLSPGELPGVVADLELDPPFNEWGSELVFNRGTVEVDYHASGNPDVPELEKEWGTIWLRDLSMDYKGKKAAFQNLTGTVGFNDEGIKLDEVLGWFGDSPFHVEGTVLTPTGGAPPRFSLHLLTNSLKSSDLAAIPLLEKIRFDGLAEVDLSASGTGQAFTFKNHLELTRAAYHFGERFKKKKGASSQMMMEGEYSSKGGVLFNSLVIDLDSNRISGHGKITNLDEAGFSVELAAKAFELHPAAQFFSLFQGCRGGVMDLEIRGSGNLSQPEEARWDGVAKVVNMQLRPPHFLNTLAIDTEVRLAGRKFQVSRGTLKSDRSNVRFKGEGKLGSTLDLDLKLSGDRLVVDELLPEPEDKTVDFKTYMSDTPFFSRGTGRVEFSLRQLNFKFLDLRNASGLLTLEDEKLKVNTLDIGKDKEVIVRGVVSLDNSEEGTLRGLIRAKNTRAENFMALFGGRFDGTLTGELKKLDLRFQSNGRGMPTLEKTLEARWIFDMSNGMIDTDGLRRGVIQLFGLKGSAAAGAPGAPSRESGLKPFTQIAGKFELSSGIVETEKFVYETGQRRTSIVGKFDLVRHEMDLVAGVAPLPTLDKFLTKIPVVGKIITGGDEESLVKAYFSVKGSFDDPKVSAIPFTSLSRKVVGIFQGIFQTPGALIPQARESEE